MKRMMFPLTSALLPRKAFTFHNKIDEVFTARACEKKYLCFLIILLSIVILT